MPTEQGESATDDLHDPAGHFPQPPEGVTSAQTQEEAPPRAPEPDRSEAARLEQEEEAGQSPAGHQSHVIRNVDEIFHTIEGLMSKLRHLKVSLCSGGNAVATTTNAPPTRTHALYYFTRRMCVSGGRIERELMPSLQTDCMNPP